MKLSRSVPALAGLLAGLFAACGRTELGVWQPLEGGGGQGGAPALPDECAVDADCPVPDACTRVSCAMEGSQTRLTCQTRPLDCDDGDQCTLDRCDVSAGGCVHDRPADADHDGFVGKAPAGLPASCGGQDCDDTDASVAPGALEICDGKDNNCNGDIDEGWTYIAASSPVPIAATMTKSDTGGITFDGSSYALTYAYPNAASHTQSFFELLNANGQVISGPARVNEINADTFAGPLDFSGTSFLTAWNDARQAGNYEIYFTRFDQKAQKLAPDQRLTNAPGYSVNPVVRFTGSEYVVIWVDRRFEAMGRGAAILAHRLSEKGELVGDELVLTGTDEDADSASFDVSEGRLGVAYVVAGPPLPDGETTTSVRFRSFDLTLGDGTGPVDIGMNGQDPSVEAVNGGFVVAWHTGGETGNWGTAIQAARFDARGNVAVAGPITSGDTHAKDRSLVSFGDRLLVVWAATTTDSPRFELWHELIRASDLSVVTPRQLLAKSANGYDLTGPHAVRGPKGDVGITFDESVARVGYFLRLECDVRVP